MAFWRRSVQRCDLAHRGHATLAAEVPQRLKPNPWQFSYYSAKSAAPPKSKNLISGFPTRTSPHLREPTAFPLLHSSQKELRFVTTFFALPVLYRTWFPQNPRRASGKAMGDTLSEPHLLKGGTPCHAPHSVSLQPVFC